MTDLNMTNLANKTTYTDPKNGGHFKTDIFNGQYDSELEKIPHYMRERVAFLIE